MSDETGDADYRLVAATVKRALKDAARGDVEAQAFLQEMLPNTVSTNKRMGDWIRREAQKGVHRMTTGLPVAATTPAATTPTANAGNTGAPDVRESTSKVMNRIIRSAAGRGEK